MHHSLEEHNPQLFESMNVEPIDTEGLPVYTQLIITNVHSRRQLSFHRATHKPTDP